MCGGKCLSRNGFFHYASRYRVLPMGIISLALIVGIVTFGTCVGLAEKRPSFTEPFYDYDVSSFGIYDPEHYVFATGFTTLSFLLCISMYFRAAQIESRVESSAFIIVNFITFILGLAHFPFITTMGWTDGVDNQKIHFPTALVGFGALSLYCITHAILTCVMVVQHPPYNTPHKYFSYFTMGWYCVVSLLCPIGVAVWLTQEMSSMEWMAVFSLFCYFMMFIGEFYFLGQVEEYQTLMNNVY
eukprot:TRINITY_DN5370_c0_g1_i5.p1 TRINITY_DN5370_c0_g1~~TRINITY_DN5370_c0_g1_i5.p1  ORF type:complete len:243 (-),score=16.11 TRINITY_DN5370_c0_g1_i5:461-1189(-)